MVKNSGRKSQVFWGKYLNEGNREFCVPGNVVLQKSPGVSYQTTMPFKLCFAIQSTTQPSRLVQTNNNNIFSFNIQSDIPQNVYK